MGDFGDDFMGTAEVAEYLGLTKATVLQRKTHGNMPPPVAQAPGAKGSLIWRRADIVKYKEDGDYDPDERKKAWRSEIVSESKATRAEMVELRREFGSSLGTMARDAAELRQRVMEIHEMVTKLYS